MKKKVIIGFILVGILLFVGVVVSKVLFFSQKTTPPVVQEIIEEEAIVEADPSITIDLRTSKAKDNTIIIEAKGLSGKVATLAYELTYESQGLIKGVNSGSKPIPINDEDTFLREIYLGTCSKNVCKADAGITKASLVMEFTDPTGKKSRSSKDFDL